MDGGADHAICALADDIHDVVSSVVLVFHQQMTVSMRRAVSVHRHTLSQR